MEQLFTPRDQLLTEILFHDRIHEFIVIGWFVVRWHDNTSCFGHILTCSVVRLSGLKIDNDPMEFRGEDQAD